MLGITEPAIFGVNIRFMRPFICGSIGGAVGACLASIMHLGASATGVTGLFAILLHLHDPIKYIIVIGAAAATAFVLTWLFGYKENEEETDSASAAANPEEILVSEKNFDDDKVYSPLMGKVIALSDVPDETFAAGVLGPGAAIEPAGTKVVAPADGEVSTVFDTHHAVGLTLDNGMEILIHIGINTVELNGEGFKAYVNDGDRVKRGQTLITFDKDYIASKGYNPITSVIIGNSGDYVSVTPIANGDIRELDELLKVERR